MAGTWTDTHLPIWSLPERGERGPKPRHSRTEIAAAAVRIADAEGIAAVTMRRVAAELGTGTMSLYNYVPAKEHLVQLMADQAAGEHAYPRSPPQDSRAAIADLARQGRDIARRHPWLPAVMHRPPPMGPGTVRYIDYFLGLLAGTGLDTAAKMEMIAIINGFALMYGGMQAALDDERARTGITEQEQQAAPVTALVQAAASGNYPNLAAVLTTPAPRQRTADEIFDSCLLRLIDGALGG
jgi:AcrR family transcriptional regulator